MSNVPVLPVTRDKRLSEHDGVRGGWVSVSRVHGSSKVVPVFQRSLCAVRFIARKSLAINVKIYPCAVKRTHQKKKKKNSTSIVDRTR